MTDMQGGCACGAIRYRVTEKPLIVHACHCLDCQRHTGSAFVINLWIERKFVVADYSLLKTHRLTAGTGQPHDIYYCPNCGIRLWSHYHAALGRHAAAARRYARRSGSDRARCAYLHARQATLGAIAAGRARFRDDVQARRCLDRREPRAAARQHRRKAAKRRAAIIGCVTRVVDTPLAAARGIAWNAPHGIAGLQLPEASESATRAKLLDRLGEAEPASPPPAVQRAIDGINALLRGNASDLAVGRRSI